MENPPGGFVHLVGAGPGDPGLITRRGAEALGRADVVVFDSLIHPRLLDLAPPGAERINAGKRAGVCLIPQDEINALLVRKAQEGRRVVRLKGGDPLLFGRGGEEAAALRVSGVPFAIVPGVTAAAGVAAYAGFSLTHRGESSAVAMVTGNHDPKVRPGRLDWHELARFPGTLVLYMGVARLPELSARLIAEGMPASTPAAMVQWATLPRQRTLIATLGTIAESAAKAGIGSPALIVIGSVVARQGEITWFESQPLFGRRIVITRPRDEAARAADELDALGAEAMVAPTVEVAPLSDTTELDRALDRLEQFDWLVFTSAHGVRFTLDRLLERGRDLRALGHLRLAVIGTATAEALGRFHLRADVIPPAFCSESLAETLRPLVSGRRVLLARADRGRTVLNEVLGESAHVEQVAAYHNRDAASLPTEVAERLAQGTVDWITLTSPAITRRLHALLPVAARERIGTTIRLASISPITTATARELGWEVAAEATVYTWDGLLAAILDAETRPGGGERQRQATSR